MEQIISIEHKHESYEFSSRFRHAIKRDRMPIEAVKFSVCCHCRRVLDVLYTFVLYKLDRAGLLDKDFLPICCVCKISLKYMGKLKCSCGRYYLQGYLGGIEGVEMIVFHCDRCSVNIYYNIVPDD